MLGSNVLDDILARIATIVVGRTSQLVLDNRVEEYEAIAVGLEGEVFELTTATIEAHQTARLAKDAGKLVHDATVDTTVVVLGSLSGQYHIPLADLIVAKEVVESEGEAALHSGT